MYEIAFLQLIILIIWLHIIENVQMYKTLRNLIYCKKLTGGGGKKYCEAKLESFLHTTWSRSYGFLKRFYLFLGRREGREKERERNTDVWEKQLVASCTPPTRDLACKPGTCPDQESNQRPFSLQAGSQSTEPHQPGQILWLFKKNKIIQARGLIY